MVPRWKISAKGITMLEANRGTIRMAALSEVSPLGERREKRTRSNS